MANGMIQQKSRNGVEPALRVSGLKHWFGSGDTRFQVLFDIALEIERGEVVILTGPSGSGKTTLLTVIGALRAAQEGDVRVLGRDLHDQSNAEQVAFRREIGFIFQLHNLFSSLTALENVRMATSLRDDTAAEMNERATAMLRRVGLGDRLDHVPKQLSGGQRQRVAIARALVNAPELVLADEPTASLDAGTGLDVLDLFHELANGPSRSTVLIVTHDQRLLDRADRIVNLVGGRVVSNVLPKRTMMVVQGLRQSKALADADMETLTRFADTVVDDFEPAGRTLVHEGEEGDTYYILAEGVAEVIDESGNVVRTLQPGDTFGRITYYSGLPVGETVRTATDVELLALTKADVDRVLAAHHDLAEIVRAHLMSRQS